MTDRISTDELLPCPFCGGEAETTYHNGGWPDGCYSVMCKNWKCPGKTSSGSKTVAAGAWNTRSPDLAAEVIRLREALEYIVEHGPHGDACEDIARAALNHKETDNETS